MRKISALLFCCLLLFYCEKFTFTIDDLNGNGIQVLGHGGIGIHSLLPMNSLASVVSCIDKGVLGTELYIQLTNDSYIVAFHDNDLSESANSCGLVDNYTWEELKEVQYTYYSIGSNYPLMLIPDILFGVSVY